jgi:hypothetical protein
MEASYQVSCAQAVARNLRRLHQEAAEKGIERQLVDAVKLSMANLRSDPVGFGEPCYRLRRMKLDVFTAVVPPLVVIYAVHLTSRLVFVKGFRLLPGKES